MPDENNYNAVTENSVPVTPELVGEKITQAKYSSQNTNSMRNSY